jgi:hypothetical protein
MFTRFSVHFSDHSPVFTVSLWSPEQVLRKTPWDCDNLAVVQISGLAAS